MNTIFTEKSTTLEEKMLMDQLEEFKLKNNNLKLTNGFLKEENEFLKNIIKWMMEHEGKGF